jgi:hypothetical protein
MTARCCNNCGELYDAQGEWMRLCWECYRVQKDRREQGSPQRDRAAARFEDAYRAVYRSGYDEGVEAGRREGYNEARQTIQDRLESVRQAGYDAGFEAGRRGGPRTSGLSIEQLRALVRLTHPDRHPPERGELANRATAALLALIDGQRSVAS